MEYINPPHKEFVDSLKMLPAPEYPADRTIIRARPVIRKLIDAALKYKPGLHLHPRQPAEVIDLDEYRSSKQRG